MLAWQRGLHISVIEFHYALRILNKALRKEA
jgi:hypothetical protein